MLKSKFLYTIILIIFGTSVITGIYFLYSDHPKPQKFVKISNLLKNSPWDLDRLSRPPKVQWINRDEKIKSLYYESIPYRGEKTNVFAYYATPGSISGDYTKDKGLPGIVFVHGGEGAANSEFVALWAQRGYAAISMDLDGRDHNLERTENSGPPEKQYMNFDWNYHALAKIILAHSLMLDFKEIDFNRTGIAGVSIGGQLTCIAASLDSRFKAAVSVYGCGFIHKDGYFKLWYDSKLQQSEQDIWQKSLDPSIYLSGIDIPFLFAASTNDRFYPLNILSDSYKLIKGACYLSIDPALKHSETGAALYILQDFFDQHLMAKVSLPEFHKPKMIGKQLSVQANNLKSQDRAWLVYTTDKGAFHERKWKLQKASIEENNIVSELLPENTTVCFFEYLFNNRSFVSSELMFF